MFAGSSPRHGRGAMSACAAMLAKGLCCGAMLSGLHCGQMLLCGRMYLQYIPELMCGSVCVYAHMSVVKRLEEYRPVLFLQKILLQFLAPFSFISPVSRLSASKRVK